MLLHTSSEPWVTGDRGCGPPGPVPRQATGAAGVFWLGLSGSPGPRSCDPKAAESIPQAAHDTSKTAPHGPETTHQSPKTAEDGPGSRNSQARPRQPQEAPQEAPDDRPSRLLYSPGQKCFLQQNIRVASGQCRRSGALRMPVEMDDDDDDDDGRRMLLSSLHSGRLNLLCAAERRGPYGQKGSGSRRRGGPEGKRACSCPVPPHSSPGAPAPHV